MSGRRVLVTGAAGFLAGPLLERLPGRVMRLVRAPAAGALACDLSDAAAARAAVREARPDLVFHLAGTTGAGDWEALWRAHVTATVNLLEALAADGRPVRVVLAGSSAEYGAAGGRAVASEDAPTEPLSAYGSSKLSSTLAALSYSRGPVEVVAARIFNVLGPGTPMNLAPGAFARQIARIAAGLQPPELLVGNLDAERDYLDVRDVAAALEALARRGRPGLVYNVGSGRARSMRSLLDELIAVSGLSVGVKVDPARRRPAEVRTLRADVARLRADTGWRPAVALSRSLADTLDWWRGR